MKQLNTVGVLFLLLTFLFSMIPVGVYADENEPQSDLQNVEFYWAQSKSSPSPTAGLITHNQIEIYEKNSDVPILREGEIENLGIGAVGTNQVYKASYFLSPGIYLWEGKMSNADQSITNTAGRGYFEIKEQISEDSTLQRFMIDRIQLTISDPDLAAMGTGADFVLTDYLGNDIEPYASLWKDINDHDLGMTNCSYLVIKQPPGDEYDAGNNPMDIGNAYEYKITPINNDFPPVSGVVYIWNKSQHFTGDISKDYKKLGPNTAIRITVSMKKVVSLTVKLTKGADIHLYEKGSAHYKSFLQYPYDSKDSDSDEEYDIYLFRIPNKTYIHYEAGGGEFLREVQRFFAREEYDTYSLTINLNRLDNHRSSGDDNDWEEASMILNTEDSMNLDLPVDSTFDLYPIRVWQAMHGSMGNYFTEPDMHIEVIDGETGESEMLHSIDGGEVSTDSISLTPVGSRGREVYRIKGISRGVSIIKITYDAIDLRTDIDQYIDNTYTNTGSSDGRVVFEHLYFNPIEPRNTAIAVVNVGGADNSGIDPNIVGPSGQGEIGQDDAIYFDSREDGVDYTFAPTSTLGDVSVRIHDPLHNTAWGDGWTEYGTQASDSDFAVRLKDGRNIVEVKTGGVVKYHVIMAKAVEVTVTNVTNPDWVYGDPVEVDDRININITGMNTPIPKMAGIYNPHTIQPTYDMRPNNNSLDIPSAASYRIMEGRDISFSIPEPGETALTNGQIFAAHYGDPWGNHRYISVNGRRPNLSADSVTRNPYHSILPDFHFYTEPEEDGDTAPVTFTGKEPGTTLIVKSNAGFAKVPDEQGAYTLPVGGPHNYYYSKPGYFTKAEAFGVGATGEIIALPPFADSDKVNQTSGAAVVTVLSDKAPLRDGQELSFDPADIPDISGNTDYNYGGYTLLHALIESFRNGSVRIPFTAAHGILSPTVQVDGEANEGAGWVCEVNGVVVPPDKLWTTLVADEDEIVFYYNAANDDQQYVSFTQDSISKARGENAVLELRGKDAGTSDDLSPIADAKILIDGRDSGAVTGSDGKATIDTKDLTYGKHVVTASKGSPNKLTYARAILNVTKPAGATGSAISFRLIGAAKHTDQNGYGSATEYANWIKTVKYTLPEGKTQVSVYDVFDWALNEAKLEFTESQTNYISRIKAPTSLGGYWLAEMDNGPLSGWMYTVNGIHANRGLRSIQVSAGDEIVWHYADDPALETGFDLITGAELDEAPPYLGSWLTAFDTDPGNGSAGNKTALRTAIDQARALNASDYTVASWQALQTALTAAQAVVANTSATQAQIDAANTALQNAIAALKPAANGQDPGDKSGNGDKTKTAAPVSIAKVSVTQIADKAWTGKALMPALALKYGGKALVKGTDYTAVYKSNQNIGKATVTVTGKGKYTGTRTATFKIVPKKISITKLTAGKKKIKATWKKTAAAQKITKYQVRYRMKGTVKWKTRTVSAKSKILTVKKLKKGRVYQIQVRSYKKIKTGVSKGTYYSAWSKIKTSKKVK
jgi:hypothetical protein